jgi:outer membrane protein assembly factor BamD
MWRYIIFFSIILFFSSCKENYNKLLKSDNPEIKLQKALEFYENEDYYRTMQLLESVLATYRGSKEAERIYYYYAYSHFHMREYMAASFHFSNLHRTLPNSQYAQEAMFMSAYCRYLNSPDFNLDQTNTKQAIAEMQSFINKYPNSDKIAQANVIIDEMRAKLEIKAFENAKLFFNLQEYRAAIVSFNNVIKDFPGTQFTEESRFLIIKSWHLFASRSISSRQVERFSKVKETYQQFIIDFPNSTFINEARILNNSAIRQLEKLQIANN